MTSFGSHVDPRVANFKDFEVYESIWRYMVVYDGHIGYMKVYDGI